MTGDSNKANFKSLGKSRDDFRPHETTEEELRAKFEKYPNASLEWFYLGKLLYDEGRYEEADEALQHAPCLI
jgi:tetratricopeptide (TPR) repeat protein